MSEEQWRAVDTFIEEQLLPSDRELRAVLEGSSEAGLPSIQVSPPQGKLLNLLARAVGARAILELGTLGGYSSLWLARALPPGGRLVTLEADPAHADVAGANLAGAGVSDRVEIRLGPALETLPKLLAEGSGPFDLVFIDADKVGYADYLAWAHRLSRVGSLIVADNVIRGGSVVNPSSDDEAALGIRRFYQALASSPGLSATAIQTVGTKGYDGLAFILVTAEAPTP
ncbi:MAG: O-methyltransferase [Candidatus Dormiibacterota bacterium]